MVMKLQIKYILALAIIFVIAGGRDVSAETVQYLKNAVI